MNDDIETTLIPSAVILDAYKLLVCLGYYNESKMYDQCESERNMSIALLPWIDREMIDKAHWSDPIVALMSM